VPVSPVPVSQGVADDLRVAQEQLDTSGTEKQLRTIMRVYNTSLPPPGNTINTNQKLN
jgi:hypothetical protein